MRALQVVAQAGIAIAGSVGAALLLGAQVYCIIGCVISLAIFMLVMSSSARTVPSTNPDVVLRPAPWFSWTLGSIALAVVLGAFWPIMPIALGLRKANERADAARVRDLYASRSDDSP